ncbi:CDP-diacylglycerol--glycerol-3-phosphate 3-phosphatidyltransferase [Aureimonas sp. SA4125]|uniref:CDP-alcohol phosphatidyltransferase family protein n=1 Tax=Aureimonas sp. SA4125 TaxID=2826993 RepID=UPI001CC3AF6F|nr:CDP-alcohol phosphatidyltransferase family protein [Aureimonas sp. SA4125]BDA83446.1 CDP-diacylglycerol--glycerol-3-phosphate 3-phosphatidyltransferase [Aureimonas sp. SA4125]
MIDIDGPANAAAPAGDRRPLASRQSRWAAATLRMLLRTPVTANQISVIGIVFALVGAASLVTAPRWPALFVVAALCIQLRLICNLMDGLVAVEGGRGSATGALYNEVPDRLEDSVLLIGFGTAAGLPWLGFTAAILAVFTAYVRAVGASHGFAQDFRGPMAKPQRMAALTIGCGLGLVEILVNGTLYSLQVVLAVVVLGAAITGVRRLGRIASLMKRRP